MPGAEPRSLLAVTHRDGVVENQQFVVSSTWWVPVFVNNSGSGGPGCGDDSTELFLVHHGGTSSPFDA